MKALHPIRGWFPGLAALMTLLLTCEAEANKWLSRPPAPAAVVARPENEVARRMLAVDEMHILTGIAGRMHTMLTVADPIRTKVWAHGLRDERGRAGIFVACSHPFVAPDESESMSLGKSWVLLAVSAAVKYTEGSPVPVDYIAFTEPAGMSGNGWYYELDLRKARQIQRELVAREMTMADGYRRITAIWQKKTPGQQR